MTRNYQYNAPFFTAAMKLANTPYPGTPTPENGQPTPGELVQYFKSIAT
jgi:hypothetical protein